MTPTSWDLVDDETVRTTYCIMLSRHAPRLRYLRPALYSLHYVRGGHRGGPLTDSRNGLSSFSRLLFRQNLSQLILLFWINLEMVLDRVFVFALLRAKSTYLPGPCLQVGAGLHPDLSSKSLPPSTDWALLRQLFSLLRAGGMEKD